MDKPGKGGAGNLNAVVWGEIFISIVTVLVYILDKCKGTLVFFVFEKLQRRKRA